MPDPDPTPEYLAPYREAVGRYGTSFESLLWRSEEYQSERFRIICEVAPIAGRIVCDLGSGRADLLAYFHQRAAGYRRYIGVEAVEELAAFSEQRARDAGWADVDIVRADFVSEPQLLARLVRDRGAETLIFSGSLNTLEPRRAAAVLQEAWDAVKVVPGGALVFNFLSTHGRRMTADTGPARRFNPTPLMKWALRRAPSVTLRHDYLRGHDATIAMRAR
ncbi:MAG: hypothetical protein ACF8R7_02080 [Phycisphaerales bacterium JB039]